MRPKKLSPEREAELIAIIRERMKHSTNRLCMRFGVSHNLIWRLEQQIKREMFRELQNKTVASQHEQIRP